MIANIFIYLNCILFFEFVFVSAKNNDTISMSEACAQSFVFFVAGFETSSSTTTYCLYELAQNLEIQEKLRNEINTTLGGRTTLSYDDVHAMSYLDKVVSGI